MKNENLLRILQEEYQIGTVEQVFSAEYGSGKTYIVSANNVLYVAKENERADFVQIYATVQGLMRDNGLHASQIIPTRCGRLMAHGNTVLYQYMKGKAYRKLNHIQSVNAVLYIKKLNHILRQMPFNGTKISMVNHWDQAKQYEYLAERFLSAYGRYFTTAQKQVLVDATAYLKEQKYIYDKLDRQCIHSDLGPDNFLFINDSVLTIVDFTPEYANELYSLCHFVYWNYMCQHDTISHNEIIAILKSYSGNETVSYAEFIVLLIYCCVFRIAGSVMDNISRGSTDLSNLNNRFERLKSAMHLIG